MPHICSHKIGLISASIVGINGIAAKIREIIRKIRKPIDKTSGKWSGLSWGRRRGLIAKMQGDDKPKQGPPKNQAEHDAQVKAGLAAIDTEEQKYLENKKISHVNAEKVTDSVKKAYPVFKSLIIVDGGETWDYEYTASPKGRQKESLKGVDSRTEVQRKK